MARVRGVIAASMHGRVDGERPGGNIDEHGLCPRVRDGRRRRDEAEGLW